jgi:hypothetical protein
MKTTHARVRPKFLLSLIGTLCVVGYAVGTATDIHRSTMEHHASYSAPSYEYYERGYYNAKNGKTAMQQMHEFVKKVRVNAPFRNGQTIL